MADKRSPAGILVRRIQFEYPDDLDPHWNKARPEWSQIVNAASLAMPYLEPYLIDHIRMAKQRIEAPALRAEADAYMGQEAHHFKQHRKFNELLIAKGYEKLRAYEATLDRDYEKFSKRSLDFNLAYAAGFETMALAIGHMLVAEREYLFRDADPAVASLVLWHFVEELEHKHATFEVYEAVCGRYFYRVYGLVYATVHIMRRTRQAYIELLRIDGLWGKWRTRWELKKVLFRVFKHLIPAFVRHAMPWHDPRRVADPGWVRQWIEAWDRGEQRLRALDTRRIAEPLAELLAV